MKYDVVVPLGVGSKWDNNELRYLLRSFEKHFSDLGKVFVVGHCPDWLINVIHIPFEDRFVRNKDANLIAKVLCACEHPELTELFIRCSDDQLLLKNVCLEDFRAKYGKNLSEYDWKSVNRWRMRLKNVFQVLSSERKTTYHYDYHYPMLFDKKTFKEVMNSYEWAEDGAGKGFSINSLYFNNVIKLHEKLGNEKATIEYNVGSVDKIRKIVGESKFLGYNDNGLDKELKSFIQDSLPFASKFEKQS